MGGTLPWAAFRRRRATSRIAGSGPSAWITFRWPGFVMSGIETQQALPRAGTRVIEGLCLSGVESGEYELTCVPLKVEDGDGAPARAILRK